MNVEGFGLVIVFIEHFNKLLVLTLNKSVTQANILSVTVSNSRFWVAAFNGFLWVPEPSPISATSLSQQQLTGTEPQQSL
jgi:hypothetical protein